MKPERGRRPNAVVRFVGGMGYLTRGLRFGLRQPSLLLWMLAPTLLLLALTIGGGALAWRWGGAWVAAHQAGHGALWAALVYLALVLVVGALAYVIYVACSLVVVAPFAGTLSERTESLATGRPPAPTSCCQTLSDGGRGVGHALLELVLYGGVATPLLLIELVVPVLGPAVWVTGLVQAALFLAFDHLDRPLSRRRLSFGAKWGFLVAHAADVLGFGTAVALAMAVPGLGLIVPPAAAVGATLLYVDLTR